VGPNRRKREDYGEYDTALNRGNDSGLTVFLSPSLSSALPDRRNHDGPTLTVRISTRSSCCSSTAVLDRASAGKGDYTLTPFA